MQWRSRWRWLSLAALVVLLDQLTKALVAQALPLGSEFAIAPIFSIVHVLNLGAAFSFLATHSGWQRWFLSAVAIVAAVVLVILLGRRPPRLESIGYALILGGALGNLADRLRRGAVVDWLDCHWGAWHWPAFNLADVAITLGVASLVLASLVARAQSEENAAGATRPHALRSTDEPLGRP